MEEEQEPRLSFPDLPKSVASEEELEEELEEEEEEFEFAFSIESEPEATADEMFLNGRILPSYPLFNRDLIAPKHKFPDDNDDSDKLMPADPADRCRKSSSTGSSASRKWKLRDLVVGRSRSDGKERFVVIPLPDEKQKKKNNNNNSLAATKSASGEAERKERSGKREMDIVTAHRIYYGKVGSGGGQAAGPGSSRRSFLPYRQELLGGLFGNAKQYHPF